MTGESTSRRRILQPVWDAVQRHTPGLATRIRKARARFRSPRAGVADARRIDRIERDAALMADHLAVISARLDALTGGHSTTGAADTDVEARIVAARLGAIAFYEERISRLEDWIERRATGSTP